MNELAAVVREAVPGAPEPLYERPRAGDVLHSFADGDLSRRALGYAPAVPLAAGIALARRHYQSADTGPPNIESHAKEKR